MKLSAQLDVQVVAHEADAEVTLAALHRGAGSSRECPLAELQPGWRTWVVHDVGHSPHLEARRSRPLPRSREHDAAAS